MELGPWPAKMTKRDARGQIARDGFMFQHGFHDLDGHVWELAWMRPDAV